MTELEKCMAGEWYDCHDKVFLEFKNKTHRLLMKYNSLPYDHKEEKRQVLKEMLGSVGTKVSIGHSFICAFAPRDNSIHPTIHMLMYFIFVMFSINKPIY